MNPLIPYIDSKNLENNGSCYTFFDDFILVYHADDSVTPYKIINDKIYVSSSSSDFPTQDSGGGSSSCEIVECDNLLNITDYSGTNRGVEITRSNQLISAVGKNSYGVVQNLFDNNQTRFSGSYYIKISHPIDKIFYPFGTSYSNCMIPAGSTSVYCENFSGIPLFAVPTSANDEFNITDLGIYVSTSDNPYCAYGSTREVCSDTPSDDSSSSLTCYSYEDITHIPHSMNGLSPFYCFLAVVIFLTLLYVPYKIFIRPFFKAKL